MSQLAVILDNLVKIFENVGGGSRKQAPTGEQQQISQEQHRNASFTTKSISPLRPLRERGAKIKEQDSLPHFASLALPNLQLPGLPDLSSFVFFRVDSRPMFWCIRFSASLCVLCGSNFFIPTAQWFQPLS
jgi:hypothetical protein